MIVFTHIPKTAGSTFTARIASAIPGGEHFIVTADRGDDGGLAQRGTAGLSLVGGHIRFPAAWPVIGPATYVAAVRRPLDRLLSHFFFAIRQGEFAPRGSDLRAEFDRFYEIVRQQRWLNLQCRFFATEGRFDRAAEVIERHYAAVWDTAETDRHFAAILDLCGLNAAPAAAPPDAYVAPMAASDDEFRAGARPRAYSGFLRADQAERVLDENAEDARLHAWVAENAGIRRRT